MSDRLLKAALRHFAEHGLSAAEQARINAEEAFFAGKSDEYRWWLAICAALDRRMAAAVSFRCGQREGAKAPATHLAEADLPALQQANDAS